MCFMLRTHFNTALAIFLILSMSVVIVQAGYLTATREEVADGTRFTIFWRQGCGDNCRVEYLSGGLFGFRNLALGPNSCNMGAGAGNTRAIHCLIGSDATGPNTPDAVVNCNRCPCEDSPGTHFNCLASGICDECFPCNTFPCPSGQTCTHVTCTVRTCSGCDSIVCESQTTSWGPWSECDAPSGTALPGNSCGPTSGTETRSRTVYSCVGADCVGSTETESRSCSGYIGCSGRWDCTGSCASYVSGACTGYSCGYSCSSGTCAQSCDLGMMSCIV